MAFTNLSWYTTLLHTHTIRNSLTEVRSLHRHFFTLFWEERLKLASHIGWVVLCVNFFYIYQHIHLIGNFTDCVLFPVVKFWLIVNSYEGWCIQSRRRLLCRRNRSSSFILYISYEVHPAYTCSLNLSVFCRFARFEEHQ